MHNMHEKHQCNKPTMMWMDHTSLIELLSLDWRTANLAPVVVMFLSCAFSVLLSKPFRLSDVSCLLNLDFMFTLFFTIHLVGTSLFVMQFWGCVPHIITLPYKLFWMLLATTSIFLIWRHLLEDSSSFYFFYFSFIFPRNEWGPIKNILANAKHPFSKCLQTSIYLFAKIAFYLSNIP